MFAILVLALASPADDIARLQFHAAFRPNPHHTLNAGAEMVRHDTTAMDDGQQSMPLFRFRSGFWLNLHHFLYVLGRDRNRTPDRMRDAIVNAPQDVDGLTERSGAERAAWDEAIGFYAAGLSKKDVVFDAEAITVT